MKADSTAHGYKALNRRLVRARRVLRKQLRPKMGAAERRPRTPSARIEREDVRAAACIDDSDDDAAGGAAACAGRRRGSECLTRPLGPGHAIATPPDTSSSEEELLNAIAQIPTGKRKRAGSEGAGGSGEQPPVSWADWREIND